MRVLIQMRHTAAVRRAMEAPSVAPADLAAPSLTIPGLTLDESYTPVPLPAREAREDIAPTEVGRFSRFNPAPEAATYLVRGEVADEAALDALVAAIQPDDAVVAVFSDPEIAAIAICPPAAVGNARDVETLLTVPQLQALGLDGRDVWVAIVDSGVNLAHLKGKGKTPQFSIEKSWVPRAGLIPGQLPVDHGTMCAFDVCISAPNCTILDYALLQARSRPQPGGSVMSGVLSDAIRAFSQLLQILTDAPEPKPALVVNNSWGMFHPSWDLPVGNPANYSDNPNHPFNILVESLEDAGADILFAAGNCGSECADSRCRGVTQKAIYGANSHPSVLSIAGITVNKERLGYSSQGPGRLDPQKPDLCTYTHFIGSGAYKDEKGQEFPDSGTSAACPVASGIVAAIRTQYSPKAVSPAQLRQLLRRTAEDLGGIGFDYNHGYGSINVSAILDALKRLDTPELKIGETVSGTLTQTGASALFRVNVGANLTLRLDGPDGVDFDLYARRNQAPTLTDFDYRAYTASSDEAIVLKPTTPGEYIVMVHSYRGNGDFRLSAE